MILRTTATSRRSFLRAGASAIGAIAVPRLAAGSGQAARPRPSAPQLAWQRDELAFFIHFGVNTFTDREWGDGRESPALFAPPRLDARQWARAASAGGFRAMVLTAKHHDGFCLWPTRTTRHGVVSSPWRGGDGDLVREFVDACRAERLRPGLYLSPWDRNSPVYGDSPRYNDLYCDQLTELLTGYGPLSEVWFDGANGEGPNGKRQVYDWPRVWSLVRRLQPNAVIFSDAGPDVRWCGNENGSAGDPNWSTVDPSVVAAPGVSGPGIIEALQHGHADGTVWRPAEADTSIRPGWFHHPAEDGRVKSVDTLVQLYTRSVGRNSKLLLNVPPTRDGVLHDTDVSRLREFNDRLRAVFAEDLAAGRRVRRSQTRAGLPTAEIDLGRTATLDWIRLEEPVDRGQSVSRWVLEGIDGDPAGAGWRVLSRGTTIGYAKLDRVDGARPRYLRLSIEEAVAPPEPIRIRAYARPT
jgi:alpha-L-fucosidase